MVALTTLKPFYQIGYLWKPENQRARELRWVPLDEFSAAAGLVRYLSTWETQLSLSRLECWCLVCAVPLKLLRRGDLA